MQGLEALGKWVRETTFTPEQVELKLTDVNSLTRALFAARANNLTTVQIERGLMDEDWFVRQMFVKRADFRPTEVQIERGMRDPSADIRRFFHEKQARWEAEALKQRHADVLAPGSNREAL